MRKLLSLLLAAGIGASTLLVGTFLLSQWVTGRATTKALVAKDVTADVLPPPLYLVELRLVLAMALDGSLSPARAREEWTRLEAEYHARVAYWEQHPPYGLEQALLGAQHVSAERFLAAARVVLDRVQAGDRPGALAAMTEAHTMYLEHRAGVDATVARAEAFAEAALDRVLAVERVAMLLSLLVFALAVLGMHRIGRWVASSVFRATGGEPDDVARIARRVAAGDLTVEAPVRADDQTSVMAAMATMVGQLRALVASVRASSDAIAAGSEQIAAGGSDLSSRTQSQLAGVHGTVETMTDVLGTVSEASDAAQSAHALADSTARVADRGAEAVREVVETMSDLSAQARQIAEISSVIDGIASQTNMLALNAAVEAARAGEQGRGFAVVASEVRELAHRCAAAAKEITQLTQASLAKVDAGAATAARAGARMDDVAAELLRMREALARISEAAAAQRDGIGTARTAMDALERAAEENAALVVQSAEAADELRGQAKDLVSLVGVFRLAA